MCSEIPIQNDQIFEKYIRNTGYFDLPLDDTTTSFYGPSANNDIGITPTQSFNKKNHPFTVFVIQSYFYYQSDSILGARSLFGRITPFINDAKKEKVLFIFSDVPKIVEKDLSKYFNNSISYAFLLDDIVKFIGDKGQNSVFENLDIANLKEQFGPCERGDYSGFYFDKEADELSKVKFIKKLED
jgi:hypothetical protein